MLKSTEWRISWTPIVDFCLTFRSRSFFLLAFASLCFAFDCMNSMCVSFDLTHSFSLFFLDFCFFLSLFLQHKNHDLLDADNTVFERDYVEFQMRNSTLESEIQVVFRRFSSFFFLFFLPLLSVVCSNCCPLFNQTFIDKSFQHISSITSALTLLVCYQLSNVFSLSDAFIETFIGVFYFDLSFDLARFNFVVCRGSFILFDLSVWLSVWLFCLVFVGARLNFVVCCCARRCARIWTTSCWSSFDSTAPKCSVWRTSTSRRGMRVWMPVWMARMLVSILCVCLWRCGYFYTWTRVLEEWTP